jgi:hypothetical protein
VRPSGHTITIDGVDTNLALFENNSARIIP